jgi:hypothetical protein
MLQLILVAVDLTALLQLISLIIANMGILGAIVTAFMAAFGLS